MSDVIEAIPERASFLDTIAARLLSLLAACGVAYLLYLSHLHYQGVSGGLMAGVDKAEFDACVSERMAVFEKAAGNAGYTEQERVAAMRAARASANALCAEMTRPADVEPAD